MRDRPVRRGAPSTPRGEVRNETRTLLLGAAVAATAAVSLPTPAFAWSGTIIPSETGSPRCGRGRMCLFYNSNQQGAK
jgi:hypothetical protein